MPERATTVIGSDKRFRVLYGGRGSGKSYSIADYIISDIVATTRRVLCTRELQNSIKDSVHKLLCDRIHELGYAEYFDIKKDIIYSMCGSEIIFKGLRHNVGEIKSTEGIDICWVEEAEALSMDSWEVLTPTIRKENSFFLISFNPENEKSPTWLRFGDKNTDLIASAKMTWRDNKYFPKVLEIEKEYDKRVDPEKYSHVWEGGFKKYVDALIFAGKIRYESFETPEHVRFYYGVDWGYSNDPTTIVRMFIKDNCLYIDYCFYGVGVELSELESAFETIPRVRENRIVADSARPETISYMRRRGFNIKGSRKGKGSVEEGIMYLRNFENIYIHTRCKGAKDDFLNYRWKRDRVTNEVLPIPEDKSNHVPDACRYALEELIKVMPVWAAV